jgi:CheY-like chemotaxis protein
MHKYKVLLVEDNPFFQNIWNSILSQSLHSYQLDWAVSENAAAKLLAETTYDIIIADIFLSGSKTGVDIWKSINPEQSKFIFSSSISQEKFELFAIDEDRPYYFIEKPLNTEHCINLISLIALGEKRFKFA